MYSRVTEITVNVLPESIQGYKAFDVKVMYAGDNEYWVKIYNHIWINANGETTMKPYPDKDEQSMTDEEWKEFHARLEEWRKTIRFDLYTAVKIANEYAPKVVVSGYTPDMVLKESSEQ